MSTALLVPTGNSALVRYEPDLRATSYLEAHLALLGEGGRLTNLTIGAKMRPPMKEDALRKWRKAHPEADAWVRQRIEASVDADKPLVIRRATELALKGSIDHANFLAKVGGWFQQPEGDRSPGAGGPVAVQVNVMVPRP